MPDTNNSYKEEFLQNLSSVIEKNLENDYKDNYDTLRFSEAEKIFVNRKRAFQFVFSHVYEFAAAYNLLDDVYSRNLFVDLMAFRMLGHRKVKLPLAFTNYKELISKLDMLADKSDWIEAGMFDWKLYFMDLYPIDIPVKMYYSGAGILIDFILKQYECITESGKRIGVKPGDNVIDAGACWGDTALFFANLAGEKGRVFSFEFMEKNVEILNTNLGLNPALKSRITMLNRAVWNVSDEKLFFLENGPGTRVNNEITKAGAKPVYTASIDDVAKEYNVPVINFIKMDIEGSELKALEGARETIIRDKPQMAISVYHNFEDFYTIINYINNLNLGYKFYLRHFTIYHEETVLYATTE